MGLKLGESGFQLDHRENATFPFWDSRSPAQILGHTLWTRTRGCGFGNNQVVSATKRPSPFRITQSSFTRLEVEKKVV